MKKYIFLFISIFLLSAYAENNLSDTEIAELLITKSISSYSGNCPCPYNTTASGRRCGKRSAYSRPGGYSPLCYRGDVTDEMIENYHKSNK